MDRLTKRQKIQLYWDGRQKMRAPDTCHAKWDALDWVNWIDSNGIWDTAVDSTLSDGFINTED